MKKSSELGNTRGDSKKRQEQQMLQRHLAREISPFTFADLPLSYSGELFKAKYLLKRVLGAGAFGLVISAIDRTCLGEQAIKVRVLVSVDYI